MLKELLLPLVKFETAFNIFQYITFRGAYAAVTALFVSFILGPSMISFLRRLKFRQSIRNDGPESHLVKSGTPTMGGLLILVSILVSVLLWQDLHNMYTWIALAALMGFAFIGFLDDYLKIFRGSSAGLSVSSKLLGQVLIAGGVVIYLYMNRTEYTTLLYIPFFKHPVVDLGLLYIPFSVLLLVFTSNAVNLTDGLDGLAIGLVILVGLAFTLLTYLTGRADYAEYLLVPYIREGGELAIPCLALVGASVGFLWYNAHPAEVFMGDTGSLALGGVLGVIALMIKKEVLLIIVGGVFVLEAMSVIIQVVSYKFRKKRVFKMAPLHHHFELKGWDESKVVIRFWILGGLFAILSLSTLKLQ
ncbi:phospho-N-acetylmuramoyl-pentapeptide-transferase [Marispirochaeta aestuarii]|uniref:phospho-N-acetylmuramoyl-pentapeptide- transferase n=1 Tax=Marispirochaeta aestuarii TaxID=1963862 RepID=UPI0029C71F00|nr:phospho-N-acetylmuramoyl-pentapeptide-transferase [Marispirochaeta aestuarii]